MVGLPGFEPGTSSSRTRRATKLRYSPQSSKLDSTEEPSRRVLKAFEDSLCWWSDVLFAQVFVLSHEHFGNPSTIHL